MIKISCRFQGIEALENYLDPQKVDPEPNKEANGEGGRTQHAVVQRHSVIAIPTSTLAHWYIRNARARC